MSWSVQVTLRRRAFELDVKLSGDEGVVVVAGPNGGGKSTLLRAIAGAEAPDSGRIEVRNRVLFNTSQGINIPSESRRVGYVPQGYGLFPHLSAVDNVAFGLAFTRRSESRSERRGRARRALGALEGEHLADCMPGALSGGERQRVALARAMVVNPDLLLLDEPLSALDVGGRRRVREFLGRQLRTSKLPALVVTHDVRDAEALEATVVVVEKGRVVQRGSVDELRSGPGSEFVAEFVEASTASQRH